MITLTNRREPNFDLLRRALLREESLERVPMLELFADREIIAHFLDIKLDRPLDTIEEDLWTRLKVQFWTELGYDAIWLGAGPPLALKRLTAEDTATLSREQRDWHAAEVGILSSWADYERYPWPRAEDADFSQLELASKIMPAGMKILASVSGALEPVMWLMGYTPFALALHDDPDLVRAIFDRLAAIYTPVAQALLDMDSVAGLFVGDDMGFKTATMISPDHMREYVLPYHRRLAELAHERDKVYVLHSCGNLETIMEDLIEDVKVDAKHSYEDVIQPVEHFHATYGKRLGVVGGIDVDFLCRKSEQEVRQRVREVLDACMPAGGYTLGTGNSVANYIPPANFLAMVQEGHAWRPGR